MIWSLLIGLAAGAIAKMLTRQQEKGGWISSIIIGLVGALVGNFIAGALGIQLFGTGLIGKLIIATGGSFLVLFIYHRFLAEKLNLPI